MSMENLSNEELMKIAGITPPASLSKEEKIKQHREKSPTTMRDIGRYASFVPRALAAAPGYISDFVNIPTHLIGRAAHAVAGVPYQEHIGHGEQTKQTIDKLSKNKTKPLTDTERVLENALDAMTGRKISLPSRAASGLGGGVSQAVMNEFPEASWEAPALGISSSILARRAPNALQALKKVATGENRYLARIKKNPYIKQKTLEEIAKQAGGQDLGQVTKADMGKLAVNAAHGYNEKSKTDFAHRFGLPQQLMSEYTKNNTHANRFVPMGETVTHFLDKYRLLESQALREQYAASPIGKQICLLLGIKGKNRFKQLEEVAANHEITSGLLTPIKDADRIKRMTGNLLSKKETIGSEDEKELSALYGRLKGDIENKYKEVGPTAHKLHKEANEHYRLHQESQVPHVNAITAHKHAPTDAAEEAIKGLEKDANASRFVSRNLQHKEQEAYHKGLAFELGKKDNAWDALTFEKNVAGLPKANQDFIFSKLSNSQKLKLLESNRMIKTLKTMEAKDEHLKEFLPKTVKLAGRLFGSATAHTHGHPRDIEKGYNFLRKKALAAEKVPDYFAGPSLVKQVGLAAVRSPKSETGSLENLSNEELRKIAGLDGGSYAKGGKIKPKVVHASHRASRNPVKTAVVNLGTDDPYGSDRSDPGTDSESDDVFSKNFIDHHIIIDRGQDIISETQSRATTRGINTNTVIAMTPKWFNRLKRDLASPPMQAAVVASPGTITRTRRPIKTRVAVAGTIHPVPLEAVRSRATFDVSGNTRRGYGEFHHLEKIKPA